LITNATFFDEEYESKVHWGHSCVGRVVEVAATAGVKNLHLFHHDPSQTDGDIDRKLDIVQDMMAALESVTKVWAPAEGPTFKP
jgi:ribonuclease BN (tRNA processing enzyme)